MSLLRCGGRCIAAAYGMYKVHGLYATATSNGAGYPCKDTCDNAPSENRPASVLIQHGWTLPIHARAYRVRTRPWPQPASELVLNDQKLPDGLCIYVKTYHVRTHPWPQPASVLTQDG